MSAWETEFRAGPKRGDSFRHLLCLVVGHRWSVNKARTQRCCGRCWLVQRGDRPTPPGGQS